MLNYSALQVSIRNNFSSYGYNTILSTGSAILFVVMQQSSVHIHTLLSPHHAVDRRHQAGQLRLRLLLLPLLLRAILFDACQGLLERCQVALKAGHLCLQLLDATGVDLLL